jgi:hypothetical protein
MRFLALLWLVAPAGCGGGDPAADGGIAVVDADRGGGDPGGSARVDATTDDGSIDVDVPGDRAWTDTEVDLALNELVRVAADGSISFEPGAEVGPGGYKPDDHDGGNLVQCANHAALIAKIGTDGAAMQLGGQGWLAAPRAGRLFLGPNDSGTGNNAGAFSVTLTPDEPYDLIASGQAVTVPATSDWVDTGLDLTDSQLLTIAASGEVDNDTANATTYGPAGVPGTADHPASLLGCANHVALIGRIGADGSPFRVGSDYSRPVGRDGRLFLRVNDGSQENNGGELSASVSAGKYPK